MKNSYRGYLEEVLPAIKLYPEFRIYQKTITDDGKQFFRAVGPQAFKCYDEEEFAREYAEYFTYELAAVFSRESGKWLEYRNPKFSDKELFEDVSDLLV